MEERRAERKSTDDQAKQDEAQRAAKAEDDNWMFKWATDENGNELPAAPRVLTAAGKDGNVSDISRKVAEGELEYDEDEEDEADYEAEEGEGTEEEGIQLLRHKANSTALSNTSNTSALGDADLDDAEYTEEEDEDYADDEGGGEDVSQLSISTQQPSTMQHMLPRTLGRCLLEALNHLMSYSPLFLNFCSTMTLMWRRIRRRRTMRMNLRTLLSSVGIRLPG